EQVRPGDPHTGAAQLALDVVTLVEPEPSDLHPRATQYVAPVAGLAAILLGRRTELLEPAGGVGAGGGVERHLDHLDCRVRSEDVLHFQERPRGEAGRRVTVTLSNQGDAPGTLRRVHGVTPSFHASALRTTRPPWLTWTGLPVWSGTVASGSTPTRWYVV